jgi:putative multiple sugar transport system substrate-binding protein
MRATPAVRRLPRLGSSLFLAVVLVMTVAAPVEGATVGTTWRAGIGAGGANGTATIRAYTTGSGSLTLKLVGMKASAYLPVSIATGTCATAGSTLLTLPAIRTTSAGAVTRTSSLTAAEMTRLTAATASTGTITIRIGHRTTGGVKCGVFDLIYVPVGVVLPANWFPGEAARSGEPAWFKDAFKATGYGVRVMASRDAATEKAAVKTLIGRGIRVLILTPQDRATSAAVADEARAAGVSVIANDRAIMGTAAVDFLVGYDCLAVGSAQAQYLIDRAGATKHNNLYIYAGAPRDPNPFLFFEGAWEKLQPKIADGTFVIRNSSRAVALQDKAILTHDEQASIIDQVTTQWDYATAQGRARADLSAASPAAKGTVFILAPNDNGARAIADVFAADKDVTKSYVTGQDADKDSIQYVIDGRQGMTVFKDPFARVKDATAAAVTFLQGRTPVATTTFDNGVIHVPAKWSQIVTVTRDNLQAVLIDSGYYKASDFTGTWPGKR